MTGCIRALTPALRPRHPLAAARHAEGGGTGCPASPPHVCGYFDTVTVIGLLTVAPAELRNSTVYS